jgi:hypothetical protein
VFGARLADARCCCMCHARRCDRRFGSFAASDVLHSCGSDVRLMLESQFLPAELRSCGVEAAAMRASGCSVLQLQSAGFSLRQLKTGGCSALELKDAGCFARKFTIPAPAQPVDNRLSTINHHAQVQLLRVVCERFLRPCAAAGWLERSGCQTQRLLGARHEGAPLNCQKQNITARV